MIGPTPSDAVLLYAVCLEEAGTVWYLVAVRGRPKRGEAGPALAAVSQVHTSPATAMGDM